MALFISF